MLCPLPRHLQAPAPVSSQAADYKMAAVEELSGSVSRAHARSLTISPQVGAETQGGSGLFRNDSLRHRMSAVVCCRCRDSGSSRWTALLGSWCDNSTPHASAHPTCRS